MLALGASGQPEVWVGDGIKMTRYQFAKAVSPTAMVLLSDRLLVLDSDTRLFAYALP